MSGIIRAHPRSRGEHNSPRYCDQLTTGSSPLARGTPVWSVNARGPAGLIPARAGNTSMVRVYSGSFWAHPRSRGEHSGCSLWSRFLQGSSPLARGTQLAAIWSRLPAGLIPARAGNTLVRSTRRHREWAHPRSRGEHFPTFRLLGSLVGSSPLARGTQSEHSPPTAWTGLIPARAGNTP